MSTFRLWDIRQDSLTLLYPDKVKVYHHRGNGLMAKSLLDSLDILSRLKQMGGIGMTERVGGKRNIKPGLGKRILQARARMKAWLTGLSLPNILNT